ncbi:MAG: ABC transporter substrate-binding protein [Acidimicrobiales bacterium]
MRVVSLVPSVTETLLAWDITPVAVTRFCEQPSLPAVGGTKDPDVAAIVALEPDVVVMCDEENRLADFEALQRAGVRVEALRIESVADVGRGLASLADAVGGRPARGLRPAAVRGTPPHGVRPDLAPAVDDPGRRHLRRVAARCARDRRHRRLR